ncbi:MAG: hypothetical protein ACFFHD_03925 [Promethearchaeota archaeon]
MSEEFTETEDGLKIRKLAKLRTETAKEYEDAMLRRVDEFKEQKGKESGFNDFLQNTIFSSLGTILDLKLKTDEAIGEENLKKVHRIIDNILLFGL